MLHHYKRIKCYSELTTESLRQPEADARCFVLSDEVASQGFTEIGVPGVAGYLRNGCYAQLIRTQERIQAIENDKN